MSAKVPGFDLPEKWQVLGRLKSYGHAAWDILPVVWPEGFVAEVPDYDGEVRKVAVRQGDPEKGERREPLFQVLPDGPWVNRYHAARPYRAADRVVHVDDISAIYEAIDKQFKKARSRWLRAQRKSGAAERANQKALDEAKGARDAWLSKVDETMDLVAALRVRACPAGDFSEDDEDWRSYWHAVDKLGVVVARARASVAAVLKAEAKAHKDS